MDTNDSNINDVFRSMTPLLREDRVEELEQALRQYPQLLKFYNSLGGLLHYALRFYSPKCIELLVARGADLDFSANAGGTPLCIAAFGGHLDSLQTLIVNGAKLLKSPKENALLSCVTEGQLEACRILLDAGYDPHYTYRTLSGNLRNALSFAIEQGRAEIAEMLRAAGCQMPREEDVALNLSMATEEPVVPEVGKEVPAQESSDDSPMSAQIYIAIAEDDVERLKSLLQQANPSEIEEGFIHFAAECGSVGVLQHLVSQGFDVNQRNSLGETALFHATSAEKSEAVKLLLSLGAEIDNNPDASPILTAIGDSNIEILQILISHRGNIHFTYRRRLGEIRNALSYAIELGNAEVIELLKAAGCRMPREEDVAIDLSIPKEKPAAVSAETSEFSDADREAIIQAIAGEFGPVEPHALQEIVPVDAEVEVRVHVIPAGEESPFLTIFTTGMSARPMTVPEGSEAFEYAELLMHLPSDWKWKESLQADSPYSWPFQWLRNIAYLPHLNATWLGGPHTIIASDDPPVPLGAGTDFTCLLLVADLIDCAPMELPSGRSVRVYTVVPIFTDERDLELREGVVALLKTFQKYFIPSVCLPGRPSVASMGT